jgi:hypothetical protein
MVRRYKKDYSLDGWPVLDTERDAVLDNDDVVAVLNDYADRISELEPPWIPISSGRLPSNGVDVLISYSEGATMGYLGDHNHWRDCHGCYVDDVTHWMPLPDMPIEPYTQEGGS